jgi:molecular chaperone DnaJ
VDSGTQLRLSQEGQPGAQGGPPGDLYVAIKVKEHAVFERHEFDLHCTVPVNVSQATLGDSIELNTFDGPQTVKIPEGSQQGTRIRLRGLGVPRIQGSGRGDLYVHLNVHIPSKLTREQRRLFEELRGQLPTENQPHEKGIFDKVKDYFL